MASVITQSWKPLIEWLSRLASPWDTVDFPALAAGSGATQVR